MTAKGETPGRPRQQAASGGAPGVRPAGWPNDRNPAGVEERVSSASHTRFRVRNALLTSPSALLIGTLMLSFGCGGGCRRASPESGPLPSEAVAPDAASDGAEASGQEVAPLEAVQAIAAHEHATCALLTDGRPLCWGTFEEDPPESEEDQGFPLVFDPAPRPLLLPGNVRLREISMWGQARGLTEDGRLMIWGRFLTPFWVSEAGGKSRRRVVVPIAPDLEPYEDIAARYPEQIRPSTREEFSTYRGLLDSVRPLWSGIGDTRRLVDGCYENDAAEFLCINLLDHHYGWQRHGPYRFPTAESVIIRGPYFACMRDGDGAVFCWFDEPKDGWEANWDGIPRFRDDTRLRIPLPHPAVDVFIGTSVCAALENGSVVCWDIDAMAHLTPETAAGLHLDVREEVDAKSINGDVSGFACAITKAERVKCWVPRIHPRKDPSPEWLEGTSVREIPGLEKVVALTTGSSHACALTDDARVWCWGSNEYGQLGRGTVDANAAEHPPGLVISAIDPFGGEK
jgi:hypothetical protein